MARDLTFSSDPAKAAWREETLKSIQEYFSPKELAKARVLHFSGPRFLEVKYVFDKLGIPRQNVWTVEEKPKVYRDLKERNEQLEGGPIRMPDRPMSLETFLTEEPVEPMDIVILDYCGYLDLRKIKNLKSLRKKEWLSNKSILITNYLKGRERRDLQGLINAMDYLQNEGTKLVKIDKRLSGIKLLRDQFDSEKERKKDVEKFSDIEIEDLQRKRDFFVQSHPASLALLDPKNVIDTKIYGQIRNFLIFANEIENIAAQYQNINEIFYRGLYCVFEHNAAVSLNTKFLAQTRNNPRNLIRHKSFEYKSDKGNVMLTDHYLTRASLDPVWSEIDKDIEIDISKGGIRILSKKNKLLRSQKRATRKVKEELRKREKILKKMPIPRTQILPDPNWPSDIYQGLEQNRDDSWIMDHFDIPKTSLAAYKAYLTRTSSEIL